MMIKKLMAGFAGGAALVLGAATLPLIAPNFAISEAVAADAKTLVDQAKASGKVGERADGYLGVVSSAPSELQAAVDEINIRRKAVYSRLAEQQNVSVSVIAALSGEKLMGKAAPGEKIMTASGSWTTK